MDLRQPPILFPYPSPYNKIMPTISDAIISTNSLTKKYKDTIALDALDMTINKGEIFGFLGHNGAGKTTTVSMLTTLLPPTSGTASVCGYDVVTESFEVKKKIGYLPENVKFYDNLTAYENLLYLANLSGIHNPKEKITEVLEFLEFTGVENKKLAEFSMKHKLPLYGGR